MSVDYLARHLVVMKVSRKASKMATTGTASTLMMANATRSDTAPPAVTLTTVAAAGLREKLMNQVNL